MHYYQFNIGDYRRDTAHLKPIEHYIYRSLIDWYYLDERPIPAETQPVMRRLSIGIELVAELDNVLHDFFVLTKNGWVHNKIEMEIRGYKSKIEVNRSNGRLGGRPKKTQVVSERLANDNRSESESNPNQEPITNNHKPLTNLKSKDIGNKEPLPARAKFKPPTIDEIKAHAIEKNLPDEAAKFFDYYESNGWKVGKNKMASWRSAFSGWCSRKDQFTKKGGIGEYVINPEVWNSLDF